VDVEIVVSCGSYTVDVNIEDTDALAIPDTLAHLAEHMKAMQSLPAVKKAMNTPLKVDDLD
jgi:hypothetical protein